MEAPIAVGSDHAGLELKRKILARLTALGRPFDDLGTDGEASVDYPDYAAKVGRAVAAGSHPLGILVCGSGIGMSIAANKIAGVRAAHCSNELEGRLARAHNDANVLCLGARTLGGEVALAIVDLFLAGHFDAGRHARRVAKIVALEGAP